MREIVLVEEVTCRHAALLEDGQLCEYFVYGREQSSSLAGSILKGRVERFVPGMGAAFVNIGLEKNGFLPMNETPSFQGQAGARPALQAGQEILVQVKKDPVGEKGAYLTRDITFPGQYVLLLPLDSFVGVSQRIKESEERESLLALGRELAPEGAGLVMRSNALQADRSDIEAEIGHLMEAWQEVQRRYPQKNAPQLLYENRDPFTELLRDYPPRQLSRIVTNIPSLAVPGMQVDCLPETDLLTVFGVRSQADKALGRKVWLKSGGHLIFDLCEAMTVIDVNTGKFTGKKLLEETIFSLNREAAVEIAHQIRLRNLGGILLIDFIDMQEEHHRQGLLDALESELQKDRVKTVVHGFTSLGLVECTRKKTSRPLYMLLSSPCPRCKGSGWVRADFKQEGETFIHG